MHLKPSQGCVGTAAGTAGFVIAVMNNNKKNNNKGDDYNQDDTNTSNTEKHNDNTVPSN